MPRNIGSGKVRGRGGCDGACAMRKRRVTTLRWVLTHYCVDDSNDTFHSRVTCSVVRRLVLVVFASVRGLGQ